MDNTSILDNDLLLELSIYQYYKWKSVPSTCSVLTYPKCNEQSDNYQNELENVTNCNVRSSPTDEDYNDNTDNGWNSTTATTTSLTTNKDDDKLTSTQSKEDEKRTKEGIDYYIRYQRMIEIIQSEFPDLYVDSINATAVSEDTFDVESPIPELYRRYVCFPSLLNDFIALQSKHRILMKQYHHVCTMLQHCDKEQERRQQQQIYGDDIPSQNLNPVEVTNIKNNEEEKSRQDYNDDYDATTSVHISVEDDDDSSLCDNSNLETVIRPNSESVSNSSIKNNDKKRKRSSSSVEQQQSQYQKLPANSKMSIPIITTEKRSKKRISDVLDPFLTLHPAALLNSVSITTTTRTTTTSEPAQAINKQSINKRYFNNIIEYSLKIRHTGTNL